MERQLPQPGKGEDKMFSHEIVYLYARVLFHYVMHYTPVLNNMHEEMIVIVFFRKISNRWTCVCELVPRIRIDAGSAIVNTLCD